MTATQATNSAEPQAGQGLASGAAIANPAIDNPAIQNPAIEVQSIVKKYGAFEAGKGGSFSVQLTATDLAGNVSTTSGTIVVARRSRH